MILKVVQTHSTVVAASDYYPFGLVMDGRQVTDVSYRYGYQGQYSEEDKTTGWNEFDLRMYDRRFGRWISPDPYGQFASPYLAMGNIPNLTIDQDGGFSFNLQSAFIGAGIGSLAMTGIGYASGARGSELQGWALAGAGLGFVGGGVGGELISGLGNIGGGDGLRMKIQGPGPGLISGAAQVGSKVVQNKSLNETAKKMIPKEIPSDMLSKVKDKKVNWILDTDEKFTRENQPGYTDVENESDPNSTIDVYVHPSVFKASATYWEYIIGHEWIHVTHVRSTAFSTWLKAYDRSRAIAISEYKAWTWSYHKDPNNDFLTFPQKRMAHFKDRARPYQPTLGAYF
jgi:RHS repeat-associated protein